MRRVADEAGSPSFGYFSWRRKKRNLPSGNPRHRSSQHALPLFEEDLDPGPRRDDSANKKTSLLLRKP
jgi:hypothetical protein